MLVPPAQLLNEVVNAAYAEVFRELRQSNSRAADCLGRALISMPRVGTQFLDFRLIAELGQGAFATSAPVVLSYNVPANPTLTGLDLFFQAWCQQGFFGPEVTYSFTNMSAVTL